jgi:hypothetical protein
MSNTFTIPIADTWYSDGHSCPICEKKYGLHSDLYTDGIIEGCGYCGYTVEINPYARAFDPPV